MADIPDPTELGEAVDAAADASEGGGGLSGGPGSVSDALLSTEPDVVVNKAKDDTGLGTAGAHGYIGFRKALHGATGMSPGAGMPAIGHFALAGLHFLTSATGDENDGEDFRVAE